MVNLSSSVFSSGSLKTSHQLSLRAASLGSAGFQFPISLYEGGICATGLVYFGPTEHPWITPSPKQKIARTLQERDLRPASANIQTRTVGITDFLPRQVVSLQP